MTIAKHERLKVPLAIAAVILSLMITTAAWWFWYQNAKQECRDAADARRDDRAMWEYLVEERGDPSSTETQDFIVYLDNRLPRLRCDGTSLVTVPPEEE